MAKDLGLTAHGAPMPLALARKLIRFLTDVGNLVVDPCAGSMTTPLAAE
ncbi:MAG: site-specific DNA-methyltransferase, partial [Burkholderiales bacterium]|nr:site-specific DNA-methyltransferase [Burkholderiales bacterium]